MMDSPKVTKKLTLTASPAPTCSASDSPQVQDSPFLKFLDNLSPIVPVKAASVAQGLVEFGSPPLVFRSPQINPRFKINLLKKPQHPQLPSGEVSQSNDEGQTISPCQDDPNNITQFCNEIVNNSKEDYNNEDPLQAQPCSSSECVDEYLAAPEEVDCAKSVSPQNSGPHRVKDVSKSSELGPSAKLQKSLQKFEEKDVDGRGRKTEGEASLTFGKKAIENHQGEIPKDEHQMQNDQSDINCHLSAGNDDIKNEGKDLGAKNERDSRHDGHNSNPQLPQSMDIVQANEGNNENLATITNAPDEDTMLHDYEVNQQRGMSRRCLQFGEAQPSSVAKPTVSMSHTRPPATITEWGDSDSCQAESNRATFKRQLSNLNQTTVLPPDSSKNTASRASGQPGIGLHLNSIVKVMPKANRVSEGIKPAKSYTGLGSLKVASMSSHVPEGMETTGATSGASVSGVNECRTEASSSAILGSHRGMGPMDIFQAASRIEISHDKRKLAPEYVDNFEDANEQSAKKKRTKTSGNNDNDGCKRCNCKKSKCLKLYCDCFAAGLFCGDSCACQGCFNRHESREIVIETRQQIESRNPLAFAPKVIQSASEFSVNNVEDGIRSTPSSARHKRGCNCKKSLCLKKYCECYQANVGCSEACRCEGCKNVYGLREKHTVVETVSNQVTEEELKGTVDENLDALTTREDFLHTELYDQDKLSPLTPSFQCSDSQRNSEGRAMLPATNKDALGMDCYDGAIDFGNPEIMEQFPLQCDALAKICDLTPLPNPSIAIASSTSPDTSDWSDVPCQQLPSRDNWRMSPITPMNPLDAGKPLHRLQPDSGLSGILEDDTPDILKHTSTPVKSVKVSSPHKKRVSPPHGHGSELGSSSSGLIRSGRKFILKAVPSFPPLTPCVDSRSRGDNSENVQDKSGQK